MGPMALGDLVGQELFWKQRKVGGGVVRRNTNVVNGSGMCFFF